MEWILLKHSLPEQGKDVLLFDGGQIYFGYYSEIYELFIVGDDKVKVDDFTPLDDSSRASKIILFFNINQSLQATKLLENQVIFSISLFKILNNL